MRLNRICLVLFSGLLLSCTTASHTRRTPASIENFPRIPALGYIPSMPVNEFASQVNKMAGGPAFDHLYFDDTAPYARDLQARLDHLAARAKKIAGAAGLPDPLLLISKSREANAFVNGMLVCMKMDVRVVSIAKAKSKASDFRKIQIKPSPQGKGFTLEQYAGPCLEAGSEDLSALQEFLKDKEYTFFNTKCRLKQAAPEIVFECPWKGSEVIAHELVLMRTIPFVTVTAGLIASLNSLEQLDAILAHELGHYYLGHGFTMTRPANYFYPRESEAPAFRPPADPTLEEAGQRLLGIGNLREGRSLPGFFEVPFEAEVMMSAMINIIVDERMALAQNTRMPVVAKNCEKLASDIFQNGLSGRAHQEYLYAAELSSEAQKEWTSTFSSIKSCLERISPKKSDENFLTYFSDQGTGQHLKYLIGDFQPSPSPDAWTAYRKIAPVIEKNLRDIHASETLRQIGYYTAEEEADVYAINFLRFSGRSQSDLQDALVSMIRSGLRDKWRRGIESEECLEAYENKWTLNGRPYRPLPVDFKDEHHDFCFRLHNLDSIYPRLGIYPEAEAKTKAQGMDYQAIKAKYTEIAGALK